MKPILYQHGPLIGQVAPARIATVKRRTSLSLARKPIFGSLERLEHTGEGEDSYAIDLQFFPRRWGGEEIIDLYDAARRQRLAYPLMRGGRRNLGFYVCEAMDRSDTYLDMDGVGQVIDVSIVLVRDQPRRAPGIIASTFDLLL